MVGPFWKPSRGRRTTPIHSIPVSLPQLLERSFINYYYIIRGELKEKEALPSLRTLAKDLKISVLTVTRAYTELEQEGFVKNVQGRGCFVLGSGSELMKEQLICKVEKSLAEAINAAKIANLSNEELHHLLDSVYPRSSQSSEPNSNTTDMNSNQERSCVLGIAGSNSEAPFCTAHVLIPAFCSCRMRVNFAMACINQCLQDSFPYTFISPVTELLVYRAPFPI